MKLSFPLVASFLLLSSTTSATPVDQKSRGRKITLSKRWSFVGSNGTDTNALREHLSHVTAKLQKGFHAYSRNTGRRHSLNRSTKQNRAESQHDNLHQKRSDAPVVLKNSGNALWHGEISVGNPPQTFSVDFDTGSSDIFLPHKLCQINCNGHKSYDNANSSTSKDMLKTFTLHYGDGSQVHGLEYSDDVTIAGITAHNQTIGAALAYSSGFAHQRFEPDGLVGMAFPAISDYHTNPVFQTLMEQNQTDEGVFAFKLGHQDSELYLGGVNKALFKGDFSWMPVSEEAYWQIDMEGITLNGTLIKPNTKPDSKVASSSILSIDNTTTTTADSKIPAIIDTGTTLLVGSTDLVSHFYSLIPGARPAPSAGPGFYSLPCDTMPDIGLVFGGKEWKIKKEMLNVGEDPEGPDAQQPQSSTSSSPAPSPTPTPTIPLTSVVSVPTPTAAPLKRDDIPMPLVSIPSSQASPTPTSSSPAPSASSTPSSSSNPSKRCLSGLVSHDGNDVEPHLWIIGDVFLRGVYSAFDVRNKRVGFAELA